MYIPMIAMHRLAQVVLVGACGTLALILALAWGQARAMLHLYRGGGAHRTCTSHCSLISPLARISHGVATLQLADERA